MSPRHKIGMVGGGGENAFFGPVHRRAMNGLGTHQLVAGALRNRAKASREAAAAWGLPHGYGTYQEMAKDAKYLGLHYVVIATPNDKHYGPAKAFVEAGVPVVCEKPLTKTVDEAKELVRLSQEKQIPFGVAYTYSGHWSLKLARAFVRSGVLGKVRRVNAFYWQGWQRVNLGIQQEARRQDPAQSGDFNCNGDINTHNHFAIRYVTGKEVTAVCCDTRIHGPDRDLDDDVDCIIKLEDEAAGLCCASQIACNHQNDHRLEVCCENGRVEWRQEDEQKLTVCLNDGPDITFVRGGDMGNLDMYKQVADAEAVDRLKASAKAIEWASHLPGGHNEAFFEALGNVHDQFAQAVAAWQASGRVAIPTGYDYPTVEDGLRGMEFLAACKENINGTAKFTAV